MQTELIYLWQPWLKWYMAWDKLDPKTMRLATLSRNMIGKDDLSWRAQVEASLFKASNSGQFKWFEWNSDDDRRCSVKTLMMLWDVKALYIKWK